MEIKPFKVIEITKIIKNILNSEDILHNIWVEGEISNFKEYASKHLYFSLKDELSVLSCVMFADSAALLEMQLQDGLKVWAKGSISVFEKQGKYQFYIKEVQQFGKGNLYLKFLELKERLQKEGLFTEENKKSLPLFPSKIAVITSESGAVIKDIITTIKKRYPPINLILVPAQVQGEGAVKTIVEALEKASKIKNLDIIILARGGGSFEDLFCFNDEKIVRAIFRSKIPIITGIGHEPDFTLADFVADRRAPTPTGAAQIAVPNLNEIKQNLENYQNRLTNHLKNKLENYKERLNYVARNKVFRSPQELFLQRYQELDLWYDKLLQFKKFYFLNCHQKLQNLTENLKTLNPTNVLNRGYSICQDKETKELLQNIDKFLKNKTIEILVKNGIADCKVIKKNKN